MGFRKELFYVSASRDLHLNPIRHTLSSPQSMQADPYPHPSISRRTSRIPVCLSSPSLCLAGPADSGPVAVLHHGGQVSFSDTV